MRSNGAKFVVSIAVLAAIPLFFSRDNLKENFSMVLTEVVDKEIATTTRSMDVVPLEAAKSSSSFLAVAFGNLCRNNNENATIVFASEDCLQQTAKYISRAFPVVPRENWCVPSLHKHQDNDDDDEIANREWQGLLLVKTPKAASSSTAGLTFHVHNKTQGRCAVQGYHYHHLGLKNPFNNRDPNRSFLFAPVRKPSSRDISHIQFFRFTGLRNAEKKPPTNRQYMKGLYGGGTHKLDLGEGIGGYQYHYISQFRNKEKLTSKKRVLEPYTIIDRLFDVFRSYGFFIVAERMDESMVVFSFLLGLDIRDVVLPTSAKVRDGSYIRHWKTKECFQQSTFPKPPEQFLEHLESPEYRRITYADQLLYRAANYSLDKTIKDTIGVDRFERALAEFRDLKERILEYCGDAQLGVTKCHPNGTVIPPIVPCYDRDFGCGYQCVGEFMELE